MTKALSDIALIETNPKMEGRQLFALYAPDAMKIKDYEKAHPEAFKKTKDSAKTEKQDLADKDGDDEGEEA